MAVPKYTNEEIEAMQGEIDGKSNLYEYRTKDYSFEMINSKFGDKNDPNADLYVPDYQREFVWKTDKQSKFIESVLLGVPLTPFLISEDDMGRLEIIDGSQRIRTLIAFYNSKFALRKLKKLVKLNGVRYKNLPKGMLKRSFMNKDFKFIIVDRASDDVKTDIFERINTTSESLTDSEIRKGSYPGDFYNLVLELKDDKLFRSICPIPVKKAERGEYEELILRFLIYSDSYLEFNHDVANFLNEKLKFKNESDFDREHYLSAFNKMATFISLYFQNGFRKAVNSGSTPRVRFEAISIGVYLALKEDPDLEHPNMEWLDSKGFKIQTTSDSSNNPDRLKDRVEFVRDGLLGRLDVDRLTPNLEQENNG